MTEADLLACQDPTLMLAFVWGKVSDRKLTLVGCACGSRLLPFLPGSSTPALLAAAERAADGYDCGAEIADLLALVQQYRESIPSRAVHDGLAGIEITVARPPRNNLYRHALGWLASGAAWGKVPEAVKADDRGQPNDPAWRAAWADELQHQLTILRDIFCNTLEPVRLDPSWMPQNAVVMARTMYESRDFTLMPLLADLLEEAGCPAEVAQHCRGPGPHVRGCWVVDLVLGKD